MKKLLILFTVVFCNLSIAQNTSCNCKTELDFVVNYYEKNLPGFKDNVTKKTKNYYKNLKQNLASAALKATNKATCFKILTQYVEFFKDNHSSINMDFPNIDEQDETALKKFLESDIYKSREVYQLTESDLKQYPLNDIRGIYQTQNAAYTIAVIPNKTKLRDYVGVIIDSKTKLWKRGQVKLEFKKKENSNQYEAFVYMRNHSIEYVHNYTFKNGILGGNWFKTNLENKVNQATNISYDFNFKMMNDSTTYIRVPTFSRSWTAKIDSLYKASFPQIRKTPYLVIDVRNNGGGSDGNAMPLLEFIYTNKIKRDKVDLYITEDNIKMWEKWLAEEKADTINTTKERIEWFENRVAMQKKAKLNTFVPISKGGKMTRIYKPNAVKKVAIIFNRNSASSCETLLFWAMQSTKTILVGENSGGYVGYGEIGGIDTPCFNFNLGCTMTRYRKQREYEADGIPPTYYLTNDKDWIEQAVELLYQSK